MEAALAPVGAVAVTTALREGHRLALTRRPPRGRAGASGAGRRQEDECRAGRAAQGEERIGDGLFEHLLREWAALRRALEDGAFAGDFASVVVVDRAAAARLRRLVVSPST